jgi:hypothetical protein
MYINYFLNLKSILTPFRDNFNFSPSAVDAQARRRAQARAENEENNLLSSPELDHRRRRPQNRMLRNTLLDENDDLIQALAGPYHPQERQPSEHSSRAGTTPPTTAPGSPQLPGSGGLSPLEPQSPAEPQSPVEPQSPLAQLALLNRSPALRVGGARQPERQARQRGQQHQPLPADSSPQPSDNGSSDDDYVAQASTQNTIGSPPQARRGVGRPRVNRRGRRARRQGHVAPAAERRQQARLRGSRKALEPYTEPRQAADISSLMHGGGKVYECRFCHALHWPGEERPNSRLEQGLYTSCCRTGKVSYNS